MEDLSFPAKVAGGLLTVALSSGGGMLVSNAIDIATLEEQTKALPEIREEIREVDDRLERIERSLAVIAAKAEMEDPE